MKKLSYITFVALLTLGACNSSLYTGVEYDDLYFQSTDQPIARVESVPDRNFDSDQYYDNIYAGDTLVSQEYSDAVDYDDREYSRNGYEYYDDYSYAGRLRRFSGSFYPYWRDPFYFGYNYPFGYNFGYGFGWPYYDHYYSPYWSPYYGYGGYYDYYSPFWPGYYGGYGYYGGLYSGFYGSYYGGYYGGYGYPGYYVIRDDMNSVAYGRSNRPSTMSSRWNSGTGVTGSTRRDAYSSTGTPSRRTATTTTQAAAANLRREYSAGTSRQSVDRSVKPAQEQSKGSATRSTSPASTRPAYNDAGRSYTPSYNNPRMPARPSYNNSRPSESSSVNRNVNTREYSNQGTNRTAPSTIQRRESSSSQGYSAPASRSNSYRSVAPSGSRSSNSYRSPGYSTPSSRSSYSSPSRSSSSYSGSSSGRSSYSSGSSYSGRSSGSSGSSYSGGSSGGSSRSSSSGGRR